MSRLRASLAQSDFDREVQSRLARAAKEVRQALALCDKAKKDKGQNASRARRVRRDLLSVLGAMEGVRRLVPLHTPEPMATRPPVTVEQPPPRPEVALKPPTILSATDVEVP
ncbi:hypothetical protein N9917_01030 [Deltaproteobacteria bacterium]|nr:hypothetical protein [Deltaproteobacteria bacterium]